MEERFAERYPALARPLTRHRSSRIIQLMKDRLRREILDERMSRG